MFRRILAVLSVILVLVVSISGIVYGAWAYKFPTTIQDTTLTNRTYTPVILGSNGQAFVDAGYMTSTGLATNMQDGNQNRKYMLATEKILTVVNDLPANSQVIHDLFTGYTPNQTSFPIITGTNGYFTANDAAGTELGNGFEIEQKGYVDVTAGSNKNLVNKTNAVSIYVDPTTTGKVNATIGPQGPSALVQVIYGGADDLIAATSTEYNVLMSGGTGTTDWNATENLVYQVMPTAGTISQLYIKTSANIAAGTATFTVMKNGAPTSVSVVINAGTSTGSDLTNSASFVAGDTVSLRYVTSGASGTPYVQWTTLWISTTPNESITLLHADATIAANTYYFIPQGGGSTGMAENEIYVYVPMPTAGTFKKMYVQLSADPGTPGESDRYVFTLRKNAAAQALTVTVTADATTGNDIVNTVAFVAGDLISLSIVPENVPLVAPSVAIGLVFTPTVMGESLVLGGGVDVFPSVSATNYSFLSGGNKSAPTWSATEATQGQLTQLTVISKLYVKLKTAPDNGAGVQSYTISVREAAGNTSLTVTVSEANTTGNDVINTYTSANGAVTDIMSVPAGTPAATWIRWGLVSRYPSTTVSVSGLSSGDKTVTTTLTGGTLTLTVTPGGTNNVAFAGAVPDNASDWYFAQNNVSAYVNSLTIDVSGVEVARYEPVAMIRGKEYSTGTVTVTNGDATVEGAGGATWTGIVAGSIFVSADGVYYVVDSVTDTDTLELTAVYAGGTLAGQTYNLYPRIPDKTGTYDGAITWGANVGITLIAGTPSSYQATASTAQTTGGFTMPDVPAPSNWWAAGADVASLPFYDAFNSAATQSGIPIQTIYLLPIWGLAFAMLFLVTGGTRSLFMGIIAMAIVLFIGSEMTVIPKWQPFMLLVLDFGVIFIQRQMGY